MDGGGVNNFYNIALKSKKVGQKPVRIKDLVVEVKLADLKGKRVAIDASNVLYEILSAAVKVNKPELFDLILRNKINNYCKFCIQQVWVFDHPKPNPLRLDTQLDVCKPINTIKLTKAHILRAQEIIKEFNINVSMITSRHGLEAEQVCAKLTRSSIIVNKELIEVVDYVITCDSDALVFGAKNILVRSVKKNMFNMYSLNEILSVSELSHRQLAIVSVILGTDFNKGIHGVGPSKVVSIVKNKKYHLDSKQKKVVSYYLKD